MEKGDKLKGDIVRDGLILFSNKNIEIFGDGEYTTLGKDGLWFQITLEEPTDLLRGETCQLVIESGTYKIEVSKNIDAGSLTFLTFSIR